MTTGDKIRELRKLKGLTQEQLGEMVGLQKAAINKYETNIVVNLKRPVIFALAKALDVSPIILLDPDSDSSSVKLESSEEINLILYYRKADEKIRRAALTMLKDSAEERETKKTDSSSARMA